MTSLVPDSFFERVIVTVLLAVVGAAWVWMGLWGLRGRETYLPAGTESGDGVMHGTPPLRGAHARWAGLVYAVAGIVALGIAAALWI